MGNPIVIDESGAVQQWTAVYWRHFGRYEESCDTFADAYWLLKYGEDQGDLSSEAILGPDGNVLMDARALFEATCSDVDPDDLFVRLSQRAALPAAGGLALNAEEAS